MTTEVDGGYEWFVNIAQLFLKLVSIDDDDGGGGGGGENGKFVEFRTIWSNWK